MMQEEPPTTIIEGITRHSSSLSINNESKSSGKVIQRKKKFPFVFDTKRLSLLSDGVIAIAITLLVLDITVPDPRDPAVTAEYVSNFLVSSFLQFQ